MIVIGNDKITSIGLTSTFSIPKTTAASSAVIHDEIINPFKKPAKARKIKVLAKIRCHHFID